MSRRAEGAARPDGDRASGPPISLMAVGLLSLATSVVLAVLVRETRFHVVGYVTGAIIPVLIIGIARRVDLDRRSDPGYRPHASVPAILAVLGVGAIVAAGLHIWPLATEFAS